MNNKVKIVLILIVVLSTLLAIPCFAMNTGINSEDITILDLVNRADDNINPFNGINGEVVSIISMGEHATNYDRTEQYAFYVDTALPRAWGNNDSWSSRPGLTTKLNGVNISNTSFQLDHLSNNNVLTSAGWYFFTAHSVITGISIPDIYLSASYYDVTDFGTIKLHYNSTYTDGYDLNYTMSYDVEYFVYGSIYKRDTYTESSTFNIDVNNPDFDFTPTFVDYYYSIEDDVDYDLSECDGIRLSNIRVQFEHYDDPLVNDNSTRIDIIVDSKPTDASDLFNSNGYEMLHSNTEYFRLLDYCLASGGGGSYADGYNDGYDVGYDDGYDFGYSIGYVEGNVEGYETGYVSGEIVGYNEGYNVGVSEGIAGLDFAEWLKNVSSSIMRVSITPALTVGGILAFVIGLALFMTLLKYFRG